MHLQLSVLESGRAAYFKQPSSREVGDGAVPEMQWWRLWKVPGATAQRFRQPLDSTSSLLKRWTGWRRSRVYSRRVVDAINRGHAYETGRRVLKSLYALGFRRVQTRC